MSIPIALKLISLSLFAIPGTPVFGSTDLNVFVASSNGNVRLDMKATETTEVADFTVKPESVVQVSEDENLVIFTQPPNQVDKVKITDSTGTMTELLPIGNNAYSLIGFTPGAYILDVIADLPNSDERAAFETILVILKEGQPPVQPVEIINKIKVVTKVTFEDDDNDRCSEKLGSAGLKFPFNKKSECDKERWDECLDDKLRGIKWDDRCKDINHGFEDDCEGFANSQECNEHWSTDYDCPANHTPIGGGVCRDDIEASEDEAEIELCQAHVGGCVDLGEEIPASSVAEPEDPNVEEPEVIEEVDEVEEEETTDEESTEEESSEE